jgi:nucleotide-binding universal stress UspA family protein
MDLHEDFGRVAAVASALAAKAYLPVEVIAVAAAHPAGSSSAERELERRIAISGLDAAACAVVPGEELIEHVGNRDGALLVIATTTWASSGADLLDPVAEDVLARVLQPVLVVGPNCTGPPHPFAPPVVVVDGSDIADAAVPVVKAWVRTFPSAGARVVEVVAPTRLPLPTDEMATHVRRYVDLLAGQGVAATGDVVRGGEPARELATFAGALDPAVVILTSPRWAGEPSHWFHTARRLIRRSIAPVLVVPADRAGSRSRRESIVTSVRPW